jgi:hypothetical protein
MSRTVLAPPPSVGFEVPPPVVASVPPVAALPPVGFCAGGGFVHATSKRKISERTSRL